MICACLAWCTSLLVVRYQKFEYDVSEPHAAQLWRISSRVSSMGLEDQQEPSASYLPSIVVRLVVYTSLHNTLFSYSHQCMSPFNLHGKLTVRMFVLAKLRGGSPVRKGARLRLCDSCVGNPTLALPPSYAMSRSIRTNPSPSPTNHVILVGRDRVIAK